MELSKLLGVFLESDSDYRRIRWTSLTGNRCQRCCSIGHVTTSNLLACCRFSVSDSVASMIRPFVMCNCREHTIHQGVQCPASDRKFQVETIRQSSDRIVQFLTGIRQSNERLIRWMLIQLTTAGKWLAAESVNWLYNCADYRPKLPTTRTKQALFYWLIKQNQSIISSL